MMTVMMIEILNTEIEDHFSLFLILMCFKEPALTVVRAGEIR